MAAPDYNEEFAKVLREHLDRLERRVEAQHRLLYGDPDLGYEGLREDVRNLRVMLDTDIARRLQEEAERREEIAERRGQKKLIKTALTTIGATNLFAILSIYVMIYNSGILR